MPERKRFIVPEVTLDPLIAVYIQKIKDQTLQKPLCQAILVDNLFKSPLFEYRNGGWFLSRRNMFELTCQSKLAPTIDRWSTFDWLVSQIITASMVESSSYSSNYRAQETSYYNRLASLAWLCFAMTYHDFKKETNRKRIALAYVRGQTMGRLGSDHPLGNHLVR